MQLVIDKCSQCDCGQQRPIVNKRHYLCDSKNYERINGRSKEDVYAERAAARKVESGKEGFRSSIKSKPVDGIGELKKKYSIKHVSNKNAYKCSDGSTVTQVEIARRYTEVIDQLKHERQPICEGQGRGDVPLSFSHTISRARCKQLGRSELIWSKDNLEIEGYHEPSSVPIYAHNIWETGTIHQRVKLLNIKRKLAIIKKYDPEDYGRWEYDLKANGYHDLLE